MDRAEFFDHVTMGCGVLGGSMVMKPAKPTWKYRFVKLHGPRCEILDSLNEYGRDHWELASSHWECDGVLNCIFKRPE